MILYRGIENGQSRPPKKIKYQPTFFVSAHNGTWTGLDGMPVEPHKETSMAAAKDWLSKPVAGQQVYGNTRYPYCFINHKCSFLSEE